MGEKTLSRKSMDLPISIREASVSSFDSEKKTARMTFSTGQRVLRRTWDGSYFEELSLDPKHVRLDRVRQGAVPFLKDHGSFFGASIDDVLGRVTEATVDGKQGVADVIFSDREEIKPYLRDIEKGILKSVSVGYVVHRMEKVGEEGGIPVLRATDWEPYEISSVAIPADMAAQFRGASKDGKAPATFKCEVVEEVENKTLEAEPSEIPLDSRQALPHDKKTGENQMGETVKPVENLEAEKIKARETEKNRQIEIRKAVKAAKLEDSFAEELITKDVTLDEARAQVISKLAESDKTQPTVSVVTPGSQDETETRREAISDALLARGLPSMFKPTEKGAAYRGKSLLRIAEEIVGFQAARNMSKTELARRALSTSDFPKILENIATKALMKSYGLAPQTFQSLVKIGTLPDYKDASRLQTGDFASLKKIDEKGEYEESSMGEAREKIRLVKYGRKILFTEETIVNDDIGALDAVSKMGAAAKRLESKLFWDVIFNNAAMDNDGVALFHATHGNLGSASAINDAGLTAARSAMRKQKSVDGEDYLDLFPAFLACGPDKETEARKILNGELLADSVSNINVFRNSMNLIVENRISGNQWYVFASPSMIDLIEMAFLEGEQAPQISTREHFDSDGVEMKIKHVVGVKALDFRGMFKNPGA